ncbi:MAG: hypothetical protein HN366_05315 [Deltaproteobacteria bacterium]|jgi:hypothetical protein|nr:hypothetical protein [Deltaproteobacteria bacterium]
MSFDFCGIEIPNRAKIILCFKKEGNGFTAAAKLVDKANGRVYMRTNRRPVTEIDITLPWDAVITEESFGETLISMLTSASETLPSII